MKLLRAIGRLFSSPCCPRCGERVSEDTVPIHTTKDGAMWVHPSDVFQSEQYKRDAAILRGERMSEDETLPRQRIASPMDDLVVLERAQATTQGRINQLEAALKAILASDGSQGVFDAIKCFDAHKMAEQVMKTTSQL